MNKIEPNDILVKDWARKYNEPGFIQDDPIQFPHQWRHKKDIEISGFISSWLSYGNRKMFLKVANEVNLLFLEAGSPTTFIERIDRFNVDDGKVMYRFFLWSDFKALCDVLRIIYEEYVSMEDLVLDYSRDFPGEPGKYVAALIESFGEFSLLSAYANHQYVKGVPTSPVSACKRICMFLRWMVRTDGIVDLGIWNRISQKDLIIPLYTHVHTMAQMLGMTGRKQADLKTALEITSYFKRLFPDDPCLGDFALYGYATDALKQTDNERLEIKQ